ncbi:MAG: HAD hydrolase-like protein [Clostridia bacterium]
MYKYFIFDMDGTLVDTTNGIITSLQRMQETMHKQILPEETLRKFIGPPLKESFIKYYGVSMDETEEMARVYRECYLQVGIDKTKVFAGTLELLAHIRTAGGKSAIATLKQHQLATMTLMHTGIDTKVDYIALHTDNSVGDKAAMICQCLEALGCEDKRQAIMVGDSPYDGRASEQAGIGFLPMMDGEGFRNPKSLEGIPRVEIAENSLALKQIICSMI